MLNTDEPSVNACRVSSFEIAALLGRSYGAVLHYFGTSGT